jgi:endonuclease III-like uncharacterized protein
MRCVLEPKERCGMLKITVVQGRRQRRLIVEGRLIAPWAAELTSAYETARTDLEDRELVVDLRSLTAIGPEGEAVLLQLVREKVRFLCGVYTREVLKQLVCQTSGSFREAKDDSTDCDT